MSKAVSFAVGLLACTSHAALASDWEFSPFAAVGSKYTDNVHTSATDEESDFVATTSAGFSLDKEGARMQTAFDYTLSGDTYFSNSDLNRVGHDAKGFLYTDLYEDIWSFDTNLALTDESSGRVSTSAGDRVATRDQTRVLNLTSGTTARWDYGRWLENEVRYSINTTQYMDADTDDESSTDQPDSLSHSFSYTVNNGTAFSRAKVYSNLLLRVSEDTDDYKSIQRHFQNTGEVPLNKQFSALISAGYDSYSDVNLADDRSGVYGMTGLRFRPSRATDMRFQVGQRYGGMVWNAKFESDLTERTKIVADHMIDVNDQQSVLTSVLESIERSQEGGFASSVSRAMVDPNSTSFNYTTDPFEQQSSRVYLTHQLTRGDISTLFEHTVRKYDVDNSEERLFKGTLDWKREVSPDANLTVRLVWDEIYHSREANDRDRAFQVGIGYTYNLMEGLALSAGYDFLTRNAEDPDSEVDENVFTVSLRKSF